MRYIKTYEDYTPYFQFENKDLKIQKIENGVNAGKILFRFYDPSSHSFLIKYSMVMGCAKIIDTENENNPKIREITIDDRFRKVQTNTLDATLTSFIDPVGELNRWSFGSIFKDEGGTAERFKNQIIEIVRDAINLGDIIDGLKIIKEEIDMIVSAKKYNL